MDTGKSTPPRLVGLTNASLIVENLDSGERLEVAGEASIYPASMIKLPIAYAVAVALESAIIDESPVVIEERFMTGNDAPSPFEPGYSARVWQLVDAMISFSDNVATNALIDRVGRARATTICEYAGMHRTAIRRFLSGSLPRIADPETTGENEHPPADAALLLRRIARGEVPYADKLLAALSAQHWNTKLSAGLMPGDTFAHKTGDTSDTSHDGGILATADGKRYIVVLYSQSPSNDETDAAFSEAMRILRVDL